MATKTKEPELTVIIERAREHRGLSLRKAADELGTTTTTYTQWMRGQVPDWKRWASRLAEFTYQDEAYITRRLLEMEGANPEILDRLSSIEPFRGSSIGRAAGC